MYKFFTKKFFKAFGAICPNRLQLFNLYEKILTNPNAVRFEQKYQHRTPAMAQNLIDKPLTVKELLFIRPQIAI